MISYLLSIVIGLLVSNLLFLVYLRYYIDKKLDVMRSLISIDNAQQAYEVKSAVRTALLEKHHLLTPSGKLVDLELFERSVIRNSD